MGHVRFRIFAHLPANTPVQPPKIPPNSFVKRNLPLTPTRSRICAQNPAIFMKTRNFGGRGRGYPMPSQFRFWNCGNLQLPELLVADGEVAGRDSYSRMGQSK